MRTIFNTMKSRQFFSKQNYFLLLLFLSVTRLGILQGGIYICQASRHTMATPILRYNHIWKTQSWTKDSKGIFFLRQCLQLSRSPTMKYSAIFTHRLLMCYLSMSYLPHSYWIITIEADFVHLQLVLSICFMELLGTILMTSYSPAQFCVIVLLKYF